MPLITILTVNYNTSEFIELMLQILNKLTKNSFQIFICDNGSKEKEIRYLKKFSKAYPNVSLFFRQQSETGSIGHGEALNFLVSKVNTPYFVILDADAVFLIKNWDEFLIRELNSSVKVVGTQASGNKPQDFPLMYAVLFETRTFSELNISFLPSSSKDINKDTGWEIREKYLEHGYKGKIIQSRNTRVYKNGPFSNLIVSEYYLDSIEQIFACHFGRGASLGYAKRRGLYLYIPMIGNIVAKFIGRIEKNRWISICLKIANSQNI